MQSRRAGQERRLHLARATGQRTFEDPKKRNVLFTGVGVERGYGYVPEIDLEQRELTMRWRERYDESAAAMPSVVMRRRLRLAAGRSRACSSIWRNRS